VEIERIDSPGTEKTIDHAEASRTEVMRALELARTRHSPWQGPKQFTALAVFQDRIQQLDREAATSDALRVTRGARTAAWVAAGAAVISAIVAVVAVYKP
jgi:hypothetical protein